LPRRTAAPTKRPPTTGAALIAQARGKNRLLALAVAAFMMAVFGLSIAVTLASHDNATARHRAALAHAAAEQHAATQ
jgi:hypothetical protein